MVSRRFAFLWIWMAVLLLPAVPRVAHADSAWEYIGTWDGVRVSRKNVAGSDVLAFRGEIVAPIHIGKVMAAFLDRSQRRFWVDRFSDQKTLETISPLSEIYWIRFGLPFPITDRDYVFRADGSNDLAHHVFTAKIKSVTDGRKGPDDCCVRAVAYGTFYRFEALPGTEKTKMQVEVHTDPKGAIPDWLVNIIQKKWPSKTLGGLIRHASRGGAPVHPDYANWHVVAPPPAPAPAPLPAPAAPVK